MAKLKAYLMALFLGFFINFTSQANELLLTTEDYAPFNYMKSDKLVGIGPDQINEIMKLVTIPHRMEMMQWSRAIGLAETRPNTCVFTTDHTPERNDKFKWVSPLYVDRMVLIKHIDNDLTAQSINMLKDIKVGAQVGDSTQEILQSNGFNNIQTTRDLSQSVKKLVARRIDAMAVSYDYFNVLKIQGQPVSELITLSEVSSGIACHVSTSDDVITQMQVALDQVIASGAQARIIANHTN